MILSFAATTRYKRADYSGPAKSVEKRQLRMFSDVLINID